MRTALRLLICFPFVLSFACSDDTAPALDGGGGGQDIALHDNGAGVDLAKPDGKVTPDATMADKAMPDMMQPDKAMPDMMQPDKAMPDMMQPDKMQPDAPPASACVTGGKQILPTGSGTCASPLTVDLSNTKVGDVVYVKVPGTTGADEKQFSYPSYSGCNPTSTARDVIFALTLPTTGASGVWVSVDAVTGADPIATMLEDTSCGQPANACSNKNGKDKEECLLAKKGGTGYFGNKPYAVVSEVVNSKKPFTVRFKMVP
jgi:hypothetical protein